MNYNISAPDLKVLREPMLNYRNPLPLPETMRGPEQVAAFLRLCLPDNSREHFLALYLSGAHQPVGWKVLSSGTANQSLVHPREILQPALILGATTIICAHNHPSGCIEPSKDDREVTTRIKEACTLLGIKLLDHLILSDAYHYSFSESSCLLV
jgi:DNA repair protein RadC